MSLKQAISALEASGLAKVSHSLDPVDLQKTVVIGDENYELDHLLEVLSVQCQLEYMRIGNQIVLRRSSQSVAEPKINSSKTKEPKQNNEINENQVREIKQTKGIDIKTFNEGLTNLVKERRKVKYKKKEHKLNYTDELISIDGTLTGTQILLKALTNLRYTYHSKPFLLSGIYSEVLEQDGQTALFVETLVDIFDRGYDSDSDDQSTMMEEVFLRDVRRSKNYIHPHIFGNIENFNSLDAVLRWNNVKYKSEELSDRIVSEAYVAEGVVNLNGQPAFKVSFKQEKLGVVYQDIYYIDPGSFSILRFEKETFAKSGYYLENQFKLANKNNLLFKLKNEYTFYEFELLEGRNYLSHAGSGGSASIVNSLTGSVLFKIDIQRDLKVNAVKVTRQKPSKKLKMDPNLSIYLQANEYDPKLWETHRYNYLNILSGQQILELEREELLDIQFRNN